MPVLDAGDWAVWPSHSQVPEQDPSGRQPHSASTLCPHCSGPPGSRVSERSKPGQGGAWGNLFRPLHSQLQDKAQRGQCFGLSTQQLLPFFQRRENDGDRLDHWHSYEFEGLGGLELETQKLHPGRAGRASCWGGLRPRLRSGPRRVHSPLH